MAWLGLDVGAKRTGVALSRSGRLTEPLTMVTGDLKSQVGQIVALVERHNIRIIVVGRPARINDSHPTARLLANLRDQLDDQTVTIATVDETLTTKEAERLARLAGTRADTDLLAACLILEQYLDEVRSNKEEVRTK